MIYGIYVSGFLSVLMIVVGVGLMVHTSRITLIRNYELRIKRNLEDLFIDNVNPKNVVTGVMIATVFIFLIVSFVTGIVVAILAAIAVLYLPILYFDMQLQARKAKFELQLPATLDMLANTTKAGLSLAQALEQTAQNISKPMSQELSLIVRDYKLGVDLKEALLNSLKKLKSKTYDLTITALIVNREKGGNLPEALFTISSSLKEIWRLEQKLITASAEGRKAIWIISGMPVFIFLMIASTQPDMMAPLTNTIAGMVLLVVSILLYVGGFYWLVKLLRIDI